MEQLGLSFSPERRTFSVSELTAVVRSLLEDVFDSVWVSGEISNARRAPSGHYYFVLKDEQAQLKCVCFRQNAMYLKVKPDNGLEVLCRGRIGVYEARGEYQLYVESIQPQGYGALQLAFEQLKKKLTAEGLFEESFEEAFLDRLGKARSNLREHGDGRPEAYYGLNMRFHEVVARSAGNPFLLELIKTNARKLMAYYRARYRFTGAIAASARDHREIATLILDRNSEDAEALMTHHVQFDQVTDMDLLAALE